MVETRKLDMWKLKDREELMKLPCAFCGEYKIVFVQSEGYESHFADSDFHCQNCSCDYPIGLFFDKTLDECKDMLQRRAKGYYSSLVTEANNKSEILERYNKKIQMYKDFNPSKRDKHGR